jgi:hypothetical protein
MIKLGSVSKETKGTPGGILETNGSPVQQNPS